MGVLVLLLVGEALLISAVIQRFPLDHSIGPVRVLRVAQHWFFRFVVVYVGLIAILAYLRRAGSRPADSIVERKGVFTRVVAFGMHVAFLAAVGALSVRLYGDHSPRTFAILAIGWHVCGIGAVVSLLAVAEPWAYWRRQVLSLGKLPIYAALPAAAAVLAIPVSQSLWALSARLTFFVVKVLLTPLCPSLQVDVGTLTLGTPRFAVTVSELCSGVEGIALMLAFCASWLWYFRRDYRFPHAIGLVPIAVVLVFLLNAVRIAGMVLIGDAGYPGVATVGFHSQAGWIAFTAAAFGVAVMSRRSSFFYLHVEHTEVDDGNATAAYLMPLLAILAAGLMTGALSAGFDTFYALRLVVAVVVLLRYRHRYVAIDWAFSWRAIAVGALIFGGWVIFARFLLAPSPKPAALSSLPAAVGNAWIVCRVAAAVITVPIAEELAYRGYLLRRLSRADFETVGFKDVQWPAIVMGAMAFGITHGSMWLAAGLAGIGYGLLVVKTGKLGESVIAHATTNGLLAIYVLVFGQWQLW